MNYPETRQFPTFKDIFTDHQLNGLIMSRERDFPKLEAKFLIMVKKCFSAH